MSECIPCKALGNCIQFSDFVPSNPTDKLYLSTAQSIVVTCPGGVTATVNLDAGLIGYVLTFVIGESPYPDLVLNCSNSTITIPVPDDTTQDQLDSLIIGMINQCLQQIATNIGCVPGTFFNTEQTLLLCDGSAPSSFSVVGSFPLGVTLDPNNNLVMAAGIIQSAVSVSDANAKALLVLNEVVATGQIIYSC